MSRKRGDILGYSRERKLWIGFGSLGSFLVECEKHKRKRRLKRKRLMPDVATARPFGPVSEITNDEKIEDCENASRDVAVTVDDIGGCEVDTCICMYAMSTCEQSVRARKCARVRARSSRCSENVCMAGNRVIGFGSINRTYVHGRDEALIHFTTVVVSVDYISYTRCVQCKEFARNPQTRVNASLIWHHEVATLSHVLFSLHPIVIDAMPRFFVFLYKLYAW